MGCEGILRSRLMLGITNCEGGNSVPERRSSSGVAGGVILGVGGVCGGLDIGAAWLEAADSRLARTRVGAARYE